MAGAGVESESWLMPGLVPKCLRVKKSDGGSDDATQPLPLLRLCVADTALREERRLADRRSCRCKRSISHGHVCALRRLRFDASRGRAAVV